MLEQLVENECKLAAKKSKVGDFKKYLMALLSSLLYATYFFK